MQIVTDSGADLSPEQTKGLHYAVAPLTLTLDGKSYVSGVDITHNDFYKLLENTDSMPTTSLPSAGEFAELYRKLAETDREILSIHISSGLSGTFNAAKQAADMVASEGIVVHVIDTMTLSGGEGWQVEGAAHALNAGWPLEKIRELLTQIREATNTIFTLPDLRYLIHGGRISHIAGLAAQVLNIKPIIGVDKISGKYAQWGRARTFNRAIEAIADVIKSQYAEGIELRVQIMHARAPEAAEKLRYALEGRFRCLFLPDGDIAPVLGAHTGPGLVGCIYAPLADYPALP